MLRFRENHGFHGKVWFPWNSCIFTGNAEIMWNAGIPVIWVGKPLIWPLYLHCFVKSAETGVFVLKMPRASWFYDVFAPISGISNFSHNFAWFPQKTHLKTYALANGFHPHFQTTARFSAKGVEFIDFYLKYRKNKNSTNFTKLCGFPLILGWICRSHLMSINLKHNL